VGFFHSTTGIGESARLCALQLAKSGYKVKCTSVEKIFRKENEVEWDFKDTATDVDVGCRIIHLNPPMLPPYVLSLGVFNFAKIYNVGYWAWELEIIPAEWKDAGRYVNAIFSPSDFSSSAIRSSISKPVITVPHPVSLPKVKEGIRNKLQISQDAFVLSTIFSFGSSTDRKNPWAVLSAFKKAFGHDESIVLVLKAIHGNKWPEKQRLLDEIASFPNIKLVDELWNSNEVAGLIKESDLYVSLHRSEGFGLTIAEAMLLGTPTMVTNWSGNLNFCNENNSFLVPVTLIPLVTDNPEYKELKEAHWADVDVDAASVIMKSIAQDYSAAQTKTNFCLQKTNAYFTQPHYLNALKQLEINQN
jgi:glycosyltransferase involved in cell wall biosynthesis